MGVCFDGVRSEKMTRLVSSTSETIVGCGGKECLHPAELQILKGNQEQEKQRTGATVAVKIFVRLSFDEMDVSSNLGFP